MSKWKIIDRGDVPVVTPVISYSCPGCDHDADLPVKGLALAQTNGGGIVFDGGPYALPSVIQCPHCRRQFETESSAKECA